MEELIDGLPNLCGEEEAVERAVRQAARAPLFREKSGIDVRSIRAAAANALHMHQPLIPGGGADLRSADVIGNLQAMMEHQEIGDNHNAPVFEWCYQRMGEFIPELVREGKQPRIMLDYSGTLFYGLRTMGSGVLDNLKTVTCDPSVRHCVEWLGTAWGHAVAPSTPVQDFRLHVRAWRHHFAAIFGLEAAARVRGFSPPEMALPNHPEVAYEFVRTLRDEGYRWVLVQEHTVEDPHTGEGPRNKHLPHRLVCRNARGEEASLIAIIKTQGSDTKLVAQMQPWFEANSLDRMDLAGHVVPPLVSQIADGENGGVMMNEFPPKYREVVRESSGSDVPLLNVSEYLEALEEMGIRESDFEPVQPIHQKTLWDRVQPGDGPEQLEKAIEAARESDHRFHMEGGSWTNSISWVQGYEDVIGPMEKVSALFHEKVIAAGVSPGDPRYRNALFHLMISQTSCYRYWGQGLWTEYGKELCRRAEEILVHDF
jgi:hypothetical protein